MNTKINLVVASLLLTVALSGCGDSVDGRIKDVTKDNIKKVAIMYKVYSQTNKFNGPANEEEFKAWAQGDPKIGERLSKFGIDVADFDSYMTSNRTNDKFEIRWGVKSRPMAPPYPVAFEPNAVDGYRQVGMAGGQTKKVEDDAEYEQLRKGIYKPEENETQQ